MPREAHRPKAEQSRSKEFETGYQKACRAFSVPVWIHRRAVRISKSPPCENLLMKASKDPKAEMAIPSHQLHADSSTPGFHRTTTKESKHMQSMMEQSMPHRLSDRIIDRRVCWYCNSSQEKTSVCSACKIARYCKKKCQQDAWVEHKPVCAQYCRMFNNPLFKKRLQGAHPQTKWIELLV